MNIGFGTTLLSLSLEKKRPDGIGIYTQALLDEFLKMQDKIVLMQFHTGAKTLPEALHFKKKTSYKVHSGLSAICNKAIGNFSHAEEKVDIFFAPDHHIPHLKKTPVVATVMDIIPFVHPEWTSKKLRKLKNFAFKKAILSATHIITISEFSKNDIMEFFGIDASKISVVTLGVDTKYFMQIAPNIKEDILSKYEIKKEFFLFIGTLQPRKNILRIIDAFYMLPQEMREKKELLIIGSNGWKTDELLLKLKKLEKDAYGKWIGYVPQEDVFALLQSAIALVYPSLYEGFGLPIVEAFASSCPVISSNTTSIPEVAGDAALLVNPLEVKEISKAMQTLGENEPLRAELIQKGLIEVQKFTWEKSAQQHMEIFHKVYAQ